MESLPAELPEKPFITLVMTCFHFASNLNSWKSFLLNIKCFKCTCACSFSSLVPNSFVTPQTVAYQASLFTGFSQQEYWNWFSVHLPGDLLNPGIETASPASSALQADSLLLNHQGSPDTLRKKAIFIHLCISRAWPGCNTQNMSK